MDIKKTEPGQNVYQIGLNEIRILRLKKKSR